MGMKGVGIKYYTILANLWYHRERRGSFMGCGRMRRSFFSIKLIKFGYVVFALVNRATKLCIETGFSSTAEVRLC